jgi:hypothetical protein
MTDSLCTVCSREVTTAWEAFCNACGGVYHFRQREDMAGEDCGEAWLNPDHLALEFACATCLAEARREDNSLEAIVTAAEAAAIASLPEEQIVAMAGAGMLPHRNAGGIYLFQRADVEAFAAGRGA